MRPRLGLEHLLFELLLDARAEVGIACTAGIAGSGERAGSHGHRDARALVDQEQLLLDAESPHRREGTRARPVLVSERAMVYDWRNGSVE